MKHDLWHFPRRDLAGTTLNLLATRLANALMLFAPRRTGKTEFLLKDLGPLAEDNGHRVIYASFWQAPLSPLAVLLHALETSLKSGSAFDRARAALGALSPKLKLSSALPGAPIVAEIDLTKIGRKPPEELLLYLDDLLSRLQRPKKPTLLLLDEVQELARSADNANLLHALRTSLDKHKDGLATVFTGSSREGLQAMFSSRAAPFFHFASPIDLPQLDEGFVDHLSEAFHAATKRSLERKAACEAFERLHHNPFFFRSLLELLVTHPDCDIASALDTLRLRLAIDLRYPETWIGLSAIQRGTAFLLAKGQNRPFSNAAREELRLLLRETEPVSIARVQAAIRKLASLGLADRWSGHWLLDDPEFAAWIRSRPPEEI